ncbi:MAG TPA: rhamnulokinase family protein [Actinocrinis sp.]|jgi:rhamnulokinase|uniref:rhamnulokinase n=1 Tax=Actinocrinis sp. TaxID=1920516 RepID=UPI002DDD8AE0|nr:rhamnulokinase family protein [Actinocrinis sp.]HEV3170679.1 rhamnulokinase family protein [Actinocrinis sp.]
MSQSTKAFAAVDLGASSGRVIRGVVGPGRLELTEIHRFPNRPLTTRGALRWDFSTLERETREGLRAGGRVAGIGVDSWAVDYGLLDADDRLLDDPIHYRDQRTVDVPEQVFGRISAQRLYRITGIQNQPFNTIHQLYAARDSTDLKAAARILMIPDLLSWRLTGVAGTEITNASTTGLLDPGTGSWSREVFDALDLDPALFAPLRGPGEPAGFAADFRAPVYTVGSHDTASAVAAVPAADENFGYVSSGTWSLVGVEVDAPVRTEKSRAANFTNELGVDGTVRYLRNVMGLWLLQECLRDWGREADLPALLDAAAHVPGRRSLIDATDPVFLAAGAMPERIAAMCRDSGTPVPRDHPEMVRCILDSLAEAYRRALAEASELTGKRIAAVHIVGGGSRNTLLCQLTADAVGAPVIAGPVEAAAIGNLLIQARAAAAVSGDLADLRALVARTQPLRRFEPSCR